MFSAPVVEFSRFVVAISRGSTHLKKDVRRGVSGVLARSRSLRAFPARSDLARVSGTASAL